MISEAEARAYRNRLLDLMRRLDRDRSQLKEEALRPTGGEASGGLSDVPLHLADLGSHSFEEEVTLGLLENEEQLIEEINAALDRLDQGTFGRCAACQKRFPRSACRPYRMRATASPVHGHARERRCPRAVRDRVAY
jgi:RNA polymerase-binding transcription factor DksA